MAVRSKLGDIKFIVEQLRLMSPSLIEEIKAMVRNPRLLSARIEERNAWLSRRFLGAASNFAEPFVVGMGLSVERLEEELVEVSMPGWWRNLGEAGFIHTGAMTTLGEFAARLYWEYHLDLRHAEATVVGLKFRSLARAKGDLRAIFRLATGEREAILQRFRAEHVSSVDSHVMIYDEHEKLVAEVETEWRLERPLALGAGHATEPAASDASTASEINETSATPPESGGVI